MSINLGVYHIETTARWQEDDETFGASADKRWVLYYEIQLKDKNASLLDRLRGNNVVGELVELMVCSPAYINNPRAEEDPDDIGKALVLDSFNYDKVNQYINDRISKISAQTWDGVFRQLNKYFNITDWETEVRGDGH